MVSCFSDVDTLKTYFFIHETERSYLIALSCYHSLFKSGVPGIGPKDSQNDLMRKSITLEHLQQCYPKETWTYIFTDGSAVDATCNGGAGVYVKYPDGTDDRLSFATGLYSTNYKAETEALRAAAALICLTE